MLKSISWQSWATPTFGGQDLIPGSVTPFFSPKQVKKREVSVFDIFCKYFSSYLKDIKLNMWGPDPLEPDGDYLSVFIKALGILYDSGGTNMTL